MSGLTRDCRHVMWDLSCGECYDELASGTAVRDAPGEGADDELRELLVEWLGRLTPVYRTISPPAGDGEWYLAGHRIKGDGLAELAERTRKAVEGGAEQSGPYTFCGVGVHTAPDTPGPSAPALEWSGPAAMPSSPLGTVPYYEDVEFVSYEVGQVGGEALSRAAVEKVFDDDFGEDGPGDNWRGLFGIPDRAPPTRHLPLHGETYWGPTIAQWDSLLPSSGEICECACCVAWRAFGREER